MTNPVQPNKWYMVNDKMVNDTMVGSPKTPKIAPKKQLFYWFVKITKN